jgi:hypothetical protein
MNMREFNLDAALSGVRIETRDGRQVTQLVKFKTDSGDILYGLDVENDHVEQWLVDGRYHDIKPQCDGDLVMSTKRLDGVVNIYNNISPTWHETELQASSDGVNIIRDQRIHKEKTVLLMATINLSEFEEGHGL